MYRKFSADHIFTGQQLLAGDRVLVTDAHGRVQDIIDRQDAGDDVAYYSGLICPGFVNAHCHLELSHLKGVIQQHTGLVAFVQQVMSQRSAPEEAKTAAMQAAEQEMLAGGIVAVGDICNTADSILIKQSSALGWHHFIEVSGFVDAVADKRLQPMAELATMFRSALAGQGTSLTPHAPYSVSKTLFQKLNTETAGQLISIHNQEAAAENELYISKTGDFLQLYQNMGIDIGKFAATGKSSLQSFLPYFSNQQTMILVHNSFTGKDDLDAIRAMGRENEMVFCLCPNANQYIEGVMPPIKLLRENGAFIVLGTDSLASNWQLSILEELKTIQRESDENISLEEMLRWATSNGARALQLDKELGDFEKGKSPGLVLIDKMEGTKFSAASSARRLL